MERRAFLLGTCGLFQRHECERCPTAPHPVTSLRGVRYYVDPGSTVIDGRLKAADRAAARPLHAFVDLVIERSDRYAVSGRTDGEAARCAVALLDAWAKGAALTGTFDAQGANHRRWAVAPLSSAFVLVRDDAAVRPSARRRVASWFGELGRREGLPSSSLRNNLLFWSAAAVAGAGVASDDRRLVFQAAEAVRLGLNEQRPEGALPRELARGPLAMGYHLFALNAVVFAAEHAASVGVDIYQGRQGRIGRLVDFVMHNLADTAEIERLAGVPQRFHGPSRSNLAWAEPWYARFGDDRLRPWLQALRPLQDRYFGGDATARWGVPLREG